MTQQPHVHSEEPAYHPAEPATGGGLTAFALVKYGFILAITVVVLYFLATQVLPLIGGD